MQRGVSIYNILDDEFKITYDYYTDEINLSIRDKESELIFNKENITNQEVTKILEKFKLLIQNTLKDLK